MLLALHGESGKIGRRRTERFRLAGVSCMPGGNGVVTPSRKERDLGRKASLVGARKAGGELGFQIAAVRPTSVPQKRRLAAAAVRFLGRSERVPQPARRHGAEQPPVAAPPGRGGRARSASPEGKRRRRVRVRRAGLRRGHVHPVPRAGRGRSPPAMPAMPAAPP